MKFTKLLFVLAVTTTVIFTCIWGGTYAWYTANNGTSLDVTTGDFNPGVAVIFTQSEYVDTTTGVPIMPEDVSEYADKTVFSLVPDSTILNGYEVNININLINVSIDNSLKISDFKYSLDCNDGTENIKLNSGNGSNITGSVLNLGTLSTSLGNLDITKKYTCTFRVWLEDTRNNQNNLMNKNFQGLIKVSSAFRK